MTEQTTSVDIVIRFEVAGSLAEVETYRSALEYLAFNMLVQTEDGLWSLGSPEAETDEAVSEYVADIFEPEVQAIRIQSES